MKAKGSDIFKLHGIIVPMVTPFTGTDMEDLDFVGISKLTDYLIHNGVNALMVNGTSGEVLLQSHEERKSVVRAVIRDARSRVPVIAGISESSTKQAVALGIDAVEAGADAVIATGPFYYKTSEIGLYEHFQSIINKVDLPLMIYNIPSWIGYGIPPEVVKKLVEKNPGRVLGVKFTTNDLGQFLEYLRLLKNLIPITIGSDALLLSGLELGGAGATVGSANVLPAETAQIYKFYSDNDFSHAREVQEKIDGFAQAMGLGTFPSGLKEGLSFIGIDCGKVRPPLVPLNSNETARVRESLLWKKEEMSR
ncbi:MAG: dihydrodipicolinate synthase family protein [Thaumarchaeota archaeon]|nr:dihydrodipicolinate synthase family protein [Nitrososphaerota archaeon]